MRLPLPYSRSLALLFSIPFLGACGDPAVTTYRTAKEPTPAIATPAAAPAATESIAGSNAAMANTAVATATFAGLSWTAPAHWVAKPASSMRKATFLITGADGATADLAVTAFPGDVGGELANVNRWRGQLGLPPISENEVASIVTRFEHNGLAFAVVDFVGGSDKTASRMLGATVPVGDATWFFKLTGPDTLVASEKPAFLAFLQTVKIP